MTAADFELHLGDCVEWLRTIEDESVDLIVQDPAYASLEKHRAIGTTTRLTADWFPIIPNERLPDLLAECYRVLKKDTHCYIFCDQETMHVLYGMVLRENARECGLLSDAPTRVLPARFPFAWRKFLVWDKRTIGMGYSYRYRHECIVYLEKGKRRLNDLSIGDVLEADRVRGQYPTEKPVSVLRTLVEQSSQPGELVIDPFLGSGSTGEAALTTGRLFAGCDVTEHAFDLAGRRFDALGFRGYAAHPQSGRITTARRPPAQGSLFG